MPFERVGRVLGVGVVELQEHVLGVADQRRDAARAQAQQAKHRQVLGMDREQDVAMEDEGDADVARRLAVVDQEVGADVQLAVVFLVEAGRLLEVVVDGVARDRQAEVLGDPALFLVGRRVEVDPHRLDVGQRLVAFDLFLEEPAVGQREDVQHEGSGELTARWSGRLPWCDEAPMLPSVAAPRGDAQRPWGGPASAGNVQDGVSKCGDEIIASRLPLCPERQGVPFTTAID